MGWKLQLFVVGIAIVGGLYLAGFFSPEPPNLDPGEGWWAKEDKGTVKVDTSVRDFKIVFPQKDQDDLKRRLENTRYFESLQGTNWEYGIRADEMKKIVHYWLTEYNWTKQEKVFNQYKHYKTNIEGLDIHFVHVKPNLKPGQKAKPIIMVHGWPGSFYEFYKIIPMLTDPTSHGGTEDDIFEVICPSLPGYGFSEAAHKPGLNPKDIARMFNTLMHERLGFDSYYVQGGDWGGLVVQLMSLFFPQYVRGHHSNFLSGGTTMHILHLFFGMFFPTIEYPLESDRKKYYPPSEWIKTYLKETGYMHLQATKPDTVGHGLTDSPVGLAAYVLEKFSFSTNASYIERQDGGLTEKFELDDLLNNVMVYWISGAIATSMRSYKELYSQMNELQVFLTYVRGHHTNLADIQPPLFPLRLLVGSFFPSLVITEERDQKKFFPVKDRIIGMLRETGYAHIQGTKPDTVGHGLMDSPVGLAAYILEKFSFWTNPSFIESPDGQLTRKYELDDLLNNVMVYWISGSITSSMRLYKEVAQRFHELGSYSSYVRGHHNNFLNIQPPLLPIRLLVGSFFPSLVIKNEVDQKKMFPVKDRFITMLREMGYLHIQATKPDTVGHGLTDSPVGLAAYILEKFSFWTNPSFIESPDGQLTKKFELDDLLNNVMVYWISGSITSSMRLYKEMFANYHEMTSYSSYVRGHHSNFLDVQPPLLPIRLLVGNFFPSLITKNEVDQKKMFPVKDRIINLLRETGYMHIQATKPDTVGHGLTDSPVGLAAYILEKFSFWTNPSFIESPNGQLTKKFELDDLLNNVMVYWISGSITSSMRLYKETFAKYNEVVSYGSATTSVPTGYASLPHELSFTPEPWLSYVYKNVISYTSFPDGGHFAAFEEPKLMAEDIRKFVKGVEDFLQKSVEK